MSEREYRCPTCGRWTAVEGSWCNGSPNAPHAAVQVVKDRAPWGCIESGEKRLACEKRGYCAREYACND